MTTEELITDEKLIDVFGNANFGGDKSKRELVKAAVLKAASGFISGSTMTAILLELGLIKTGQKKPSLTKFGKEFLWAAFHNEINV